MSTIERQTIEIENAREIVASNEFKANETATRAQALKVGFLIREEYLVYPVLNTVVG